MTKKTAVILFNLGGPDEIKAVKPFLFNLFNDPAIIDLPKVARWLAAKVISRQRKGKATAIYNKIGGKSPILELTNLQAQALEKYLSEQGKNTGSDKTDYRVFVSMRYWHPMSGTVAKNVKNYAPDRIILLPLYPQFSTTTTASSFKDWDREAGKAGICAPTTKICCYPSDFNFIAAHAKLIRDAYWKAAESGKPRILFSAHGLPEKTVKNGDPYQWQVEKTVSMITQVLSIEELDYTICYQSRVGMLKWLEPSVEAEIKRAGNEKIPVLVVPVTFVSEHSETLVELDIDYRDLAEKSGVTGYVRVPALGTEPLFIEALAELCLNAHQEKAICSCGEGRTCPENFVKCPYTVN